MELKNNYQKIIIFLFSFSVISEMFLYFIFGGGLFDKLSRIIQVILLFFFIIYFIFKPIAIVKKIELKKTHLYFIFFIVFTICTTVIGFFNGTFYDGFIDFLVLNGISNLDPNQIQSRWSEIFLIPVKETIKYIYFYTYFVVIFPLIINSKEKFILFLKYFSFFYAIALIIGFVALADTYNDSGTVMLSRHWYYNDQMNIGFRFFGIFGEPRDATVALIFGIFILYVGSIYRNKPVSYILIGSSLVALSLTMSGSFLISLIILPFLYLLLNPKIIFNLGPVFFISIFLIIISFIIVIYSSERTQIYFAALINFFNDIQSAQTGILHRQAVNVYPIMEAFRNLFSIDIFFALFGHGTGASNILKIPGETFSLYGPHSLLSRLIYDFGFVGTLFWIFIIVSGMYQLRKFYSDKNFNILLFVYIMLISISIAHKSHLIMIALGVTMILSNLYSNDEYEDLSSKPKLLARKF